MVRTIYNDELGGSSDQPPGLKRVMMLEVSQYLENYLWPNFDAGTASFEHVMSIILMVNEKFREGVPAWASFDKRKVSLYSGLMSWVQDAADVCEPVGNIHQPSNDCHLLTHRRPSQTS